MGQSSIRARISANLSRELRFDRQGIGKALIRGDTDDPQRIAHIPLNSGSQPIGLGRTVPKPVSYAEQVDSRD
jgi:hypothetical protein